MAFNINQRLNGLHSLSYLGENSVQPPDFVTKQRPPNTTDSKNFALGDIWLDITGYPVTLPEAENVWMLVALSGGVAKWINFAGASSSVDHVVAGENINLTGTAIVPVINLNEVIRWPNTNSLGTTGAIYLGATCAGGSCIGGTIFMHNYGIGSTFLGSAAGANLANGTANTGIGFHALTALSVLSPGSANTAVGGNAMAAMDSGVANVAIGNSAMIAANSASSVRNVAVGNATLFNATTADSNSCLGYEALLNLVGGSRNVAVGQFAASGFTGNESDNIIIGTGSLGVVGDVNTLRVGLSTGNTPGNLNRSFIHGIRGITTTVNDAIAVLIDSAGQLGTVSSSIRYKENVKDMGDYSEVLSQLRPVVFNYRKRSPEDVSVGLIAEEVATVAPQLAVYDKDGQPETVKYLDLITMILNEQQKLAAEVKELKRLVCSSDSL